MARKKTETVEAYGVYSSFGESIVKEFFKEFDDAFRFRNNYIWQNKMPRESIEDAEKRFHVVSMKITYEVPKY